MRKLPDYEKFNSSNLNKILSKFKDKPENIKILYLSTYNPEYTRTETILQMFDRNKIKYKTILVGKSKIKYLKVILELIKNQSKYDLIFVGFRGHEVLPFVKMFTRKPIIFDAFVSVFDTLCLDRKIFKPNSVIGKLLKKYDSFLCKISNLVLVDTKTHKEYFNSEFGAKNVDYLYVGANYSIFKPIRIKKKKKNFIVLWYGNCLPLQGVDVILKSAKLLEKENKIKFKLVGPIRKKYCKLIEDLDLKNVEFVDYVKYELLPNEINRTDLCLGGHFSNIPKAKRVIAGKSFQFLACNRPTLLGDCESNREIFKEGQKNIYFVEMGDYKELSEKIMEISNVK